MASRSKKKQQKRGVTSEEIKPVVKTRKDKIKDWFSENGGALVAFLVVVVFVTVSAIGLLGNLSRAGYSEYNQIINGNPTLMKIGSVDCPNCQAMEPDMLTVARDFDGRVNMIFYDAWNSREGRRMANKYNVTAVPTLIFFDENDVELSRLEGTTPRAEIIQRFSVHGWT